MRQDNVTFGCMDVGLVVIDRWTVSPLGRGLPSNDPIQQQQTHE